MITTRTKILVVDDDPDFREAITAILQSAGHDTVMAVNAADGASKLLAERPDLVLLDIMMDNLFDGYSLCHAIKTAKEFESVRTTPIIFVSAVKTIAGSRFGFKGEDVGLTGPDDYMDKPVKAAELLARINRILVK
jgi:two-component system alkaline phosphatase synthesis response regulator PhoP